VAARGAGGPSGERGRNEMTGGYVVAGEWCVADGGGHLVPARRSRRFYLTFCFSSEQMSRPTEGRRNLHDSRVAAGLYRFSLAS
jgi:hypothetical protein